MIKPGLMPDTITIDLDKNYASILEQVVRIDGANIDPVTIIMECFDWAKFSYSADFIDSILRKIFYRYFEEDEEFDKFSEKVGCLVKYFEEQIYMLQLTDEDQYIPYRAVGLMGNNTVILQYRALQLNKPDLINEESNSFKLLEALVNNE